MTIHRIQQDRLTNAAHVAAQAHPVEQVALADDTGEPFDASRCGCDVAIYLDQGVWRHELTTARSCATHHAEMVAGAYPAGADL